MLTIKLIKRESYILPHFFVVENFCCFIFFFCYNFFKEIRISDMDYVSVIIEAFWQYHIAFAGALAAIVSIKIVYKIISSRLR